ncbi:hypothetical protein [Neobacillus vireti]|uniref:hypothetical protein n=1 Tax=Neobacillus vireti TaxID=220686 RepID=UPI003000688C
MSVLDRSPFLYLSCIIAGFALLRVPLTGFLAPLSPLVVLIGVLAGSYHSWGPAFSKKKIVLERERFFALFFINS